jgi:hypothetical protein
MQQIVRKIFQIRDTDAAVAAMPFVELFSFEVIGRAPLSISCHG